VPRNLWQFGKDGNFMTCETVLSFIDQTGFAV